MNKRWLLLGMIGPVVSQPMIETESQKLHSEKVSQKEDQKGPVDYSNIDPQPSKRIETIVKQQEPHKRALTRAILTLGMLGVPLSIGIHQLYQSEVLSSESWELLIQEAKRLSALCVWTGGMAGSSLASILANPLPADIENARNIASSMTDFGMGVGGTLGGLVPYYAGYKALRYTWKASKASVGYIYDITGKLVDYSAQKLHFTMAVEDLQPQKGAVPIEKEPDWIAFPTKRPTTPQPD